MSPVADSWKNPTGKYNAIASICKWLEVNVPGGTQFTWFFTAQQATAVFPRVEVEEFQYPDLGNSAYGGVVFPAGAQSEGQLSQMMLKFDFFTSNGPNINAKQALYEARDRVVYALRNAGRSTDRDATALLPAISVLDYNGGSSTDTQTVARVPMEEDNAFTEQYFAPTAEQPNVHQLRLLVKFHWWEMWA